MPITRGSPPVYIGRDSSIRRETSEPPTPPEDTARTFFRANSAGKTQFCVKHDDGSITVLSTQP